MVRKATENDVVSISKSYTATSKGILLIFCAFNYSKSKSESIKRNGTAISPVATKTAYHASITYYTVPVKKGDIVNLSISASNNANSDLFASYFMAIAR